MDLALITAVTFSVLMFFLTSIAIFVTRKRNYRHAPVIVTSATHTAPNGYTVPQMPVGAPYQTQIFSTPYVAQGAPVHKPADHMLTTTAGIHHNVVTSYPTMVAENMYPPSYDLAVSGAVANRNQ